MAVSQGSSGQSFGQGYGGFGGFGQQGAGYGGFGQQGAGYGGFGQGYGGFGGFQTPYTTQQAPQQMYGALNNLSAKDLQDYVSNIQKLPTQIAAPSVSDLASASGRSGNVAWDKLVTDYMAANPKVNMKKGWGTNATTKSAYQSLLDQYNSQNADAMLLQKENNARALASGMQQYGISASDLARSGALSEADYTKTFRPSSDYQGVTNPTQYYQPIYQSQYQNYASPAYAYQGAQNNMTQGYQSPLRSGYGGAAQPSYVGRGIDGLLGQLGGRMPLARRR